MKRGVTKKLDPARVARFGRLRAVLEASRRKEASGFDAYYEALGEILEGALYVDGGWDTAKAFIRDVVKEPERTALRNVRVARHASPDEEAKYGVSLLDAALTLIEAKAGGPVKGPLPVRFDKLRVEVDGEGGVTKKTPLAEATVAQVLAHARALATGKGKARRRSSPEETAIAETLSKWKSLRSTSVHVADMKVRLGPVPLHSLPDLIRALRAVVERLSKPKP